MNLRLADLDLAGGVVFVRSGKGGKDRVVPVTPRALWWLEEYLRNVRPSWAPQPDEGHLFVSRQRRPVSTYTVTQRLREAVQRSGIQKSGHPHAWRHTAATLLLEGGATTLHLTALLGHRTARSTVGYIASKHAFSDCPGKID